LEAASNKGYDLDISTFERLATTPGFPKITLETQRRMRPDISRWETPGGSARAECYRGTHPYKNVIG